MKTCKELKLCDMMIHYLGGVWIRLVLGVFGFSVGGVCKSWKMFLSISFKIKNF